MMKRELLCLAAAVLALTGATQASAQWKPAGDKIKTKWAEEIDPSNVLPEYPRPQMTRNDWKNLNGLWDYSIIERGAAEPTSFDGEILVPFCIESSLSGVMKNVNQNQEIWYNRTFDVPSGWRGRDILLHFGAVDWKADVYVNDILVGSHTGGFTPFSFNITPFLSTRGSQKLSVRVWDPTSSGYQPRGKQINKPEGIWYSPVSGIWQTVWIEPVASSHISYVKSVPDLDSKSFIVTANAENTRPGDFVTVDLMEGSRKVASAKGIPGNEMRLLVREPKLWSPDSPFLYDMRITLTSNGKKVDEVGSYTAMRKISVGREKRDILRMRLNNKALFQFGPLDQGWWPDGLYTAPTDEALVYDIQKTKDLGYNMIRKHVKVEPARWFYHCDRLGILVWQDMPNGDHGGGQWNSIGWDKGRDANRSQVSRNNYMKEWKEIIDFAMPFPSVVVWVPFNESWGQFETEKVCEWTKGYDPSRLINPASGGNHRHTGDMIDQHTYPSPRMPMFDKETVNVLGEYGGIGYPMNGHLWFGDKDNWGYGGVKNSKKEVTDQYIQYAKELELFSKVGYAAAVYTQTTDVEGEVNGLMTYDRKEMKVDEARIKEANMSVIQSMHE